MTSGGVDITLNNLIAQGKARPMVLVMPLGYGSPDGLVRFENFERALLEEVIPQVERAHNVSRDRTARAIAGVSVGGAQAVSIGLRHDGAFGWIGSFSGALQMLALAGPSALSDPMRSALDPGQFGLVYVSCGATDRLAALSRALTDDLRARGFKVTSVEVPGVGHVWPLWRQSVADMMQMVFQAPRR